jgi:transcriptional regulator with XRE-family HTH domain
MRAGATTNRASLRRLRRCRSGDETATIGGMTAETAQNAPNVVLRQVRMAMRLSQDELARAVREAGQRSGEPNDCSKRQIQRWEAGEVAAPRAVYVRALEMATGRPIESLGFGGDYATTRRQAIGLGAAMMMPDPSPRASRHSGPLTGIWLSRYEYESSGRGQTFTDRHYCVLTQRGDRLTVRSLPNSAGSSFSMDLVVAGQVVTGNWTERSDPSGYYQGAVYHGAIQMVADPTGRVLSGKWVGFGRDFEVNTGPWELSLVTDDVSQESMAAYDRPVDE